MAFSLQTLSYEDLTREASSKNGRKLRGKKNVGVHAIENCAIQQLMVLHITIPHATLNESKDGDVVLVPYFLDLYFSYLVLGTLRSDYSDGNENVIKPVCQIHKTITPQVHYAFLYISFCRHCSPTTWNFLVSRFMEDVNSRQQFSFSFSDLRYSPLESTPEKFPNIWQIEWNGIRKFETARFKCRFRCRCRRAVAYKLPIKLKEKLKEAVYISVYIYREYLVLREETGLKHSDARDWKHSRRVVVKDRGLWISPGYFTGK